jgi:hypothetical protein
MRTIDEHSPDQAAAFASAVEIHSKCLAQLGPDDEVTIEAAMRCLLLMPRTMFNELQSITRARVDQ